MRYGLELPNGGSNLRAEDLVELGMAAEQAGWDGVFFEDYLVYYRGTDPPTWDPWVILSAIAARTEHISLGTTVTGLLARDPVKLAREAATLESLAPNRVVLGVGLGDPQDAGARVCPQRWESPGRGAEMDRRLTLLHALLTGEPVAIGDGPPVVFAPAAPGVRVWLGGSAQANAVARRAASADGVVPFKLTDTSDWSDWTEAEVADLVRSVAQRRSSDRVFDVAIGGRRRLSDLDAESAAIIQARAGGATWWMEFVHPGPREDLHAHVAGGPVRPG